MTRQKNSRSCSLELSLLISSLAFLGQIKKMDLIESDELKQHKPLIEQIQAQRANYLQEKYENLSENPQEIKKFQRAYLECLNDIYWED